MSPRYLPYPDASTALARTEAWATHVGCGRSERDVTRYWFGVIERPEVEDPEAPSPLPAGVDVAIAVPDGDPESDRLRLSQLIREDQLSAEELAVLVAVYPAWEVGAAYAIDDLRAYDGTLWRCVQAHTSQSDWTPPEVPALWTPTVPPDVIPEWVQPTGAHDAYQTGDLVTYRWKGTMWVFRSNIDANTTEPSKDGNLHRWWEPLAPADEFEG